MAHTDDLSDPQTVTLTRPGQVFYRRVGKRILDISLCLLLLPVCVPLIAALWLMTRLDSGPGFFAHERVGLHGRTFKCWKIRTMVPDAEDRLADYLAENPAARAEWSRTQKLQNDPRTTWLGRLLRRTSLDELPQIWNVLNGDMSLVGPRPVTEDELGRLGPLRQTYLRLTPGVTGLWQVNEREDGCYDRRIKLDQRYATQMGLWVDLGLILQTAVVVFLPTGR